jgi:hypothetical protein
MYLRYFVGLFVLLLSLWIIPNIDYYLKTKDSSSLVLTDHFERKINYILMRVGISGVKEKVVIGENNFLFLGDLENNSVEQYLNKNLIDKKLLKIGFGNLEEASNNLNVPIYAYFAPSKASIYSEYLPIVENNNQSPMNSVLEAVQLSELVSTNREEFLINKSNNLLFYKWDTHWNDAGAYLGYQHIMKSINSLYSLKLNSVDGLKFIYPNKTLQGDLSNMLKLKTDASSKFFEMVIIDNDTAIEVTGKLSSDITIYEIDNNTFEIQNGFKKRKNKPVSINLQSKLITNTGALNDLTVLWLRDSFGKAISMNMQQTFVNTYQVHPVYITSVNTAKRLLQTTKPDLIIYSLAERHGVKYVFSTAHSLLLGSMQIKDTIPKKNKADICLQILEFDKIESTNIVQLNINSFKTTSLDPQFHIAIDQKCLASSITGKIKVPEASSFQVYYRRIYEVFSEEKSVYISLTKGDNNVVVNLPVNISNIRLDPINKEGVFKLENFQIQ